MYGILLESIKATIIESYGGDVWTSISTKLDLDNSEINPYAVYPEELIPNIIGGMF